MTLFALGVMTIKRIGCGLYRQGACKHKLNKEHYPCWGCCRTCAYPCSAGGLVNVCPISRRKGEEWCDEYLWKEIKTS